MAYITHRKSGNNTYYYIARSEWKNGRSHQVIIDRLGTAEQLFAARADIQSKAETPETPETKHPDIVRVLSFGAEAALYDLSERLGVADIINKYAKKRSQGLSIGSYIQLAAINRAIAPVSKLSFFQWFRQTSLTGMFPDAAKHSLSSQSFWNHMTGLDQEQITAIEDELTAVIVNKYKVSTGSLLFDNTNFMTYIDTSNPAAIPQRGHSKEKRTDLKIIGLSLMVSPEFNIPLFHEIYPGNKCDSKQFIDIIDKLKARSALMSDDKNDTTLIFDKGNNSENIVAMLEDDTIQKYHFVGGLRLNQCPELLETERNQYAPLVGAQFKKASAFRTQKEVCNQLATVLVTDNPCLRDSQLVGIEANMDKCKKSLQALKDRLQLRAEGKISKGKKPTFDSVSKNVKDILSADYMKKIFKFNIGIGNDNHIYIDYYIDYNSLDIVKSNHLGKTILFTNRNDWSNEQIVAAYRAQFHVEEDFRQMKNIKYLSFRPVRHFTDRTIRVHAFYCVLALTLCCLLKLEMNELGHDISINRLLTELNSAKQVLAINFGEKKDQQRVTSYFSESSNISQDYINKYHLQRYGAKL